MTVETQEKTAAYQANNFEHLLGTPGFSDTLLKNHFTLYQGYAANTNKLAEELRQLHQQRMAGTPSYAELKRRFGWEFNGMRLHELYFGNMSKTPVLPDDRSPLYKEIVRQYGTWGNWQDDFQSTGTMRGIGWVVLCHDPIGKRLFNTWIGEHDTGHLAGCAPLLVMDVFEHAFILDYGLKRADYIAAFLKVIDWKAASGRFHA